MRRALVLLFASFFGTLAAGCAGDECAGLQCGPCPPALTVRVQDTHGQPVPGAAIPGYATDCSSAAGCSFGSSAGEFHFEVTAPGFKPQHVMATAPSSPSTGCCACGYESTTVTVVMQPDQG